MDDHVRLPSWGAEERGVAQGEQWRRSSGRAMETKLRRSPLHLDDVHGSLDAALLGLLSLDPSEERRLGSPAEEFVPAGRLAEPARPTARALPRRRPWILRMAASSARGVATCGSSPPTRRTIPMSSPRARSTCCLLG
jgi:hypothetical protein